MGLTSHLFSKAISDREFNQNLTIYGSRQVHILKKFSRRLGGSRTQCANILIMPTTQFQKIPKLLSSTTLSVESAVVYENSTSW